MDEMNLTSLSQLLLEVYASHFSSLLFLMLCSLNIIRNFIGTNIYEQSSVTDTDLINETQ